MEDRNETNEGIELDKIEVPSQTTPYRETPPSKKMESEPGVSPSTTSIFWKICLIISKEKLIVGAVLAVLLIGAGVIYLSLKDASWDKRRAGAEGHYIGRIVYEIVTPVGGKHDVRFTLSVPFRTYEEKNRLMQQLPSIKHELSMSGGHVDWARSNDQKNFQILREQILNRVHALTGVPLEALDVEALSWD